MANQQQSLVKEIHDALAHLYDLPYLLSHPLVYAVVMSGRTESPGRALRRLLLDAIQELKPPAESPHDSVAVARYQFLHLRYVQGKSIEEIARQLNVSERQLYRRQHDALEAVTTLVARHFDPAELESQATPAQADAPALAAVDHASPTTEVDRIGAAHASPPLNLLEVLDGALGTIAPLCQSAGCEIQLKTDHAAILTAIDRVALRQALLALLTFAIDAAHRGKITVGVMKEMEQARISVTIPATVLDRLPSIDDSNLAVCRRLIELQGGWVQLDPGAPARCVISLPTARRRTVLVVDDNADSRRLFTRYLEGRGYYVSTAASGEEALQATLRERPDGILLDVMLPSSDGYEVLQALASDPSVGRVPIVVCTVLKQRDLALALGATEFLAKPVTQGELLGALDRCWARSDGWHRRSRGSGG